MMILGYSCLIRGYKDFLTARGGPRRHRGQARRTDAVDGAAAAKDDRAAAGVSAAPDTAQGASRVEHRSQGLFPEAVDQGNPRRTGDVEVEGPGSGYCPRIPGGRRPATGGMTPFRVRPPPLPLSPAQAAPAG